MTYYIRSARPVQQVDIENAEAFYAYEWVSCFRDHYETFGEEYGPEFDIVNDFGEATSYTMDEAVAYLRNLGTDRASHWVIVSSENVVGEPVFAGALLT